MQKHFRQSLIIILAKYFEYIEIITYLCPMIINAETIFCIYISEVKLKGEFPWPFYTIKAPLLSSFSFFLIAFYYATVCIVQYILMDQCQIIARGSFCVMS